ncbi:hypothetical protein GC176_20445 [bacterium]|nr:hypothetical protein [bacterium]
MASEQHICDLSESRFFQRLQQCEKRTGVGALVETVKATWEQADAVTKRVSVDFRDYTLHDMRHLGNVLWLMEQLVPPDFWETPWQPGQPVGPLQCAVSILAVLVHDLGMAMPDDKRSQLKSVEDPQQSLSDAGSDLDRDVIAYRRHFMSQEHDVRAIQALEREKPKGYKKRVEHIRQQIRTEYLRQTHADDAIGCEHRIGSWLEHFEQQEKQISFEYAGQPFREKLAQVALSHGQSLAWLEKTFAGNAIETWRTDETIDWLWTGWLLRLGDILDFDASRAPKVLFRQFRPGNDTSIKHWYQHLCIGERVFNSDFSRVEFRASSTGCPNPDILAGVDSYCGWIRDELKGVREQREKRGDSSVACPLRLPGHGEQDVSHTLQIAGGWNSQPVKFELSQDQVVNILMGEELYGEPSLCLRELIQNALDALHLRWMRTELRRKLEEKHNITPGPGTPEPPELHGLEPVDRVRDKSELEVKVRWDRDTLPDDRWPTEAGRHPREERSFIEIEDNGVGMTFDVVTRYFTQIGCSYYKSPEYSRERALMRDFKLPVSEISQFGIGILSCFMLADLVEVWTVPSRADGDSRQPHHLKVWGPDGLFWHKALSPHDRPCGTSIRMWLRSDVDAICDPERLLEDLKSYHFGDYEVETYSTSTSDGRTSVDPLRAIWSTVVWPRYPISLQPPATSERESIPSDACHLDDTAVLRVLLPISEDAIHQTLQKLCEETDSAVQDVGPLTWRVWDQEDLATASRLRFAVAVPGSDLQRVQTAQDLFEIEDEDFPLATLRRGLAAAVLPDYGLTRWIVRGMSVPETDELNVFHVFTHGSGAYYIVDLGGHAAPGLTSDRIRIKRTRRDGWAPEVQSLIQRWAAQLAAGVNGLSALRSRQHAIDSNLPHPKSLFPVADWSLPDGQLSLRGHIRLLQWKLIGQRHFGISLRL